MNVVRVYALIVSLLGLSILAAAVEPIQVAVITGGHDFETEFWFLFKGYDDINITRLPVKPGEGDRFAQNRHAYKPLPLGWILESHIVKLANYDPYST